MSIKIGMPFSLRLAIVSLLLWGSLSAAPQPWTQLKVGMSAEQTVTLLGDPVFRRRGHGFQTWTYDDGAEVLLCGVVVGWTTPISSAMLSRSEDVWSNHPSGDYFSPVRAVLRKHGVKRPVLPVAKPPPENLRSNSGMGYEEYLQMLARSKA